MLTHRKSLMLSGRELHFSYRILTGEIRIHHGEHLLFKQLLWLPLKTYELELFGEAYQLRAMLLPITKIGLRQEDCVICESLFSKLHRYTLFSFLFNSSKRAFLATAYLLS